MSIFIILCGIYLLKKYKMYGSYKSFPYKSSINRKSTSLITTKMKCDGKTGIVIGLRYIAIYFNPGNESEQSIVYYFGFPYIGLKLTYEAFFNK